MVLVDDLGAIDDRIIERLPNIKGLFIDHGLRFDHAYSETPLCCPGRASMLTGQHTKNHGVWKNLASLLDPSLTIATALQDAGYETYLVGKYLNKPESLTDKTPPGWTHIDMKRVNAEDSDGDPNSSDFWLDGEFTTIAGDKDRIVADRALIASTRRVGKYASFLLAQPNSPPPRWLALGLAAAGRAAISGRPAVRGHNALEATVLNAERRDEARRDMPLDADHRRMVGALRAEFARRGATRSGSSRRTTDGLRRAWTDGQDVSLV